MGSPAGGMTDGRALGAERGNGQGTEILFDQPGNPLSQCDARKRNANSSAKNSRKALMSFLSSFLFSLPKRNGQLALKIAFLHAIGDEE